MEGWDELEADRDSLHRDPFLHHQGPYQLWSLHKDAIDQVAEDPQARQNRLIALVRPNGELAQDGSEEEEVLPFEHLTEGLLLLRGRFQLPVKPLALPSIVPQHLCIK